MINIFDIGIILLFLMFIITGFKTGVIRELVSLVGIVVVFIISYMFKGVVGNTLCLILPFFKFSGVLEGLSTINILLYQVIAFIILFSILLGLYAVLIKISKLLQKLVNLTIILWLPSKLLGAVVSFIKGYIVLFVVMLLLMIPLGNQSIFTESSIVNMMLYNTPVLSNSTSSLTSSFSEIYNLGEKVSNKEISTNDANLETINIMLKYNVVDKSTITRLVSLGKLKDISNIDSVLNNY
jgi:uncharacterized membrane protein required for colicin V production